jgi:HAE1 family hydrophobic/amphiphilic exporter-1
MALGLGEGAELRSPLAITVIGGLACATPLTLLVIPVVYSLLDRSPEPIPAAAGAGEEATVAAVPAGAREVGA